jgi:hypothetical protein
MDVNDKPFVPVKFAVLTVSDTRDLADDKSGALLAERIETAGHVLAASRHRQGRRSRDPRQGAGLDQRQEDRRDRSPPAAPASPAAT